MTDTKTDGQAEGAPTTPVAQGDQEAHENAAAQSPQGDKPGRRSRRRTRSRHRGNHAGNRSVPLHKRVVSHFQAGDRKRGSEYVVESRVQLHVDGTRARARVKGNERQFYAVGLDWSRVASDRELHAFCGCERFAQGRPCKHLWATLMALADAGVQNLPSGGDRLKLHRDRANQWTELGAPAGAEQAQSRSSRRRQRNRSGRGRRAPVPTWRSQLTTVRKEIEAQGSAGVGTDQAFDFRFLVNTQESETAQGIVLDVFGRAPSSGKLKRAAVDPEELETILLPDDDHTTASLSVVTTLTPDPVASSRGPRNKKKRQTGDGVQRFQLPRHLYSRVLPHLCEQGALGWWDGKRLGKPPSVKWETQEPWQLVLRFEANGAGTARLRGGLEREGEVTALTEALLVVPTSDGEASENGSGAYVLFPRALSAVRVDSPRELQWIAALKEVGEIIVPREDLEEALAELLELPGLPRLEAPEGEGFSLSHVEPQPHVALEPDPNSLHPESNLLVELSFAYEEMEVSAADSRPTVIDWENKTLTRRHMDAEHNALVRLLELGVRPISSGQGHALELDALQLPAVAEPLLLDGWTVETRGVALRPPHPPSLRVESGIDWFELSGSIDFDGDPIELQEILDAVSRGDRFVALKDGSRGLLPGDWMDTYDSLAKLAHSSSDEGLRYLPSQALLVDALLAATPAAAVDPGFKQLREKLQSFERIRPKKELSSFNGTLRGYQRDGLGWLHFLREYGLGGVLADDMGLGKTIQVLALLLAQRTASKTSGLPFLVVAPRSLVYNWMDEAARFTPKMKVVEYLGSEREALRDHFNDYDLVITTYGTMRRDIGYLATVEFDTVILDEAQAIKNSDSQTAKASRLLVGKHRLALTGTPIENHLGELGSIFEFLNPGFLGRLPKLDVLASGGAPSKQQLELVATGVRPFILRRTKAQVLKDLPPKTEQVLFCTLGAEQQELYDRLRATYQASLLKQVEKKGVTGSTMQVLEALLRLRQIACHPGLVDPEWEKAGSAKLDDLFDQVSEVLDEGHKAIIFSQFTKLLAYVRQRLDAKGVSYAYLDGQTRNRGEVVEQFQSDATTNLFLISLKAGGVGLNLTAAGYVFLLDPWWNPAVEAQAIDRAHRIGQTQPVFAYRMIARDTVEEKILDLQKSKRQIADAILGEGEGQSLSDLTADDLRMLLS